MTTVTSGALPIRFVMYRSRRLLRREWRWRALAGNNRLIANSGEGYQNRQDCLDAIKLLQQPGSIVEVRR